MKNLNVNAEGGELVIKNAYNDYAIIPLKDRKKTINAIKDECFDCVDTIVRSLPILEEYDNDSNVNFK